jgi:energy-coupling factor transport system ATP-binding protein
MEQNKKAVVEFEKVIFGYTNDTTTIDNVSFVVEDNDYICVIGHNGSGKSTISKIITGLHYPRSGKVKIIGQEVNRANIRYIRNDIGIVFQNPDSQFVGLTVRDDIAFGLENHKLPPYMMDEIIHLVAKATGISNLLNESPGSLSGGQKQRVAIASVLASNPKIIIFDESTAMLDPNAKQDLKKLMLDLKHKYGRTIISVTHDMEEVVGADKVLIMNHGKLIKFGTPKEIFEDRDFLTNISLDVPFNLRLSFELQKQNTSKKEFSPSIDLETIINDI